MNWRERERERERESLKEEWKILREIVLCLLTSSTGSKLQMESDKSIKKSELLVFVF